jgi:hypothetical protein
MEVRGPNWCTAEASQHGKNSATVHLDQAFGVRGMKAPGGIAPLLVSPRKSEDGIRLSTMTQRAGKFDIIDGPNSCLRWYLEERQVVFGSIAIGTMNNLSADGRLSAHTCQRDENRLTLNGAALII